MIRVRDRFYFWAFSLGILHPIFCVIFVMLLMSRQQKRITPFRVYFFVLFAIFLLLYYVYGRAEHMPESSDLLRGGRIFLYALSGALPFIFLHPTPVSGAVKAICMLCVPWVSIIVLYTLVNFPELMQDRMVMNPFSKEEVYSPGLINAAALSAGYLYLIQRSRMSFAYVAVSLLISLLAQNRTGLMLCGGFIALNAHDIVKYVRINSVWQIFSVGAILSVVVWFALNYLDIFLDYIDYTIARFDELGVSSNGRAEMQDYAWDAILKGLYPGGGLRVPFISFWFHNIWLDSYRTAGYVGMLALAIVVGALILGRLLAGGWRAHIIFAATLMVASTSVPFEGYFLEYFVIFSILLSLGIYSG